MNGEVDYEKVFESEFHGVSFILVRFTTLSQ